MIKFLGFTFGKPPAQDAPGALMSGLNDLGEFIPGAYSGGMVQANTFNGDKFQDGFGATKSHHVDYWTLRRRSAQLFTDNLYARGLIRRLITNEINTGLNPEAAPDEAILGAPEDSLNDWTENVETRFAIWAKDPLLCDYKQADSFGALQRAARMEALVTGDVLVVLRQSQRNGLPQVQLISGNAVSNPTTTRYKLKTGHTLTHGVEHDARGRVVAHWVQQKDFTHQRVPAYGEKSGRKISWLIFGTDKRLDDVRGQPILSLVLQSLKEIDRYRDSAQRKAVVNSVLAMFIKKTQDKPGTLPLTGGAYRRDAAPLDVLADQPTERRAHKIADQIPGVVMEELQHGEEPVGFHSQGTDLNFGTFETAILQSIAWANEIPPEILQLSFSSNYSASQAAINEFKMYINRVWNDWGETFCTPIYIDWLISESLQERIPAPQLIEAWRDPMKYDIFGAWTSVDWYGSIKPSTDALKQARGSEMLVENGWSTNAREARINTGTKFSKNIQRTRRENELKVKAAEPLAEFKAKYGQTVQKVLTTPEVE